MILETARLTLRPPEQGDLDGWAALMGDPVAMRHMGGAKPRSVAWRSMATVAGHWQLRGYGMFSVVERASGRWIGRIGPWFPEGWPGTEVGWSLLPAAWGQGYASEAAAATAGWAFDTLGWSEVVHVIAPANAPSQAVAARLGSSNRGPVPLPPPFADDPAELWGQTLAQWRDRPR